MWLTPFSPNSSSNKVFPAQDTPRSDHTGYVVAMQLGTGARLCHFLKMPDLGQGAWILLGLISLSVRGTIVVSTLQGWYEEAAAA